MAVIAHLQITELDAHCLCSEEQIRTALHHAPVSLVINTYGVERNNPTVPQHSRRMGRKFNAFSKGRDFLEYQLTQAFAYYHFVIPHLTPAMAARPPKGAQHCAQYKMWHTNYYTGWRHSR